jgi:Ni/Co efflux regulator RcnB
MKRQRVISTSRIIAAALAISLMTGSLTVQARDNDRDHDRKSRYEERRGHDRHARQHDNDRRARNHDHDRHERHARSNHHHERQWRYEHAREQRWDRHQERSRAYAYGYQQGRFDAGRYYRPSGYRHYAWHRGARLPSAYCAPRYIVHDYASYRLHRPPHGHRWVRVDHDVVLAAVATGAVVAVVNNLFY